MLMDSSSELVHSLLPIFMTTVLGASMVTVGVIEGIAEATSSVVKVFSGMASDCFRKRKWLVVFGYGLAALSKPIFPLASSVGWVFTARFIDRIGKGIRGAPRDSLIADIVQPDMRGAAYGLRQALDSVGAFIGPLLAVAFMILFANNITAVLWVAVVPAFLAVLLLVLAVPEPQREPEAALQATNSPRLILSLARHLPSAYWFVVVLGTVFTLARFSEAFLILRAQNLGLAFQYVPVFLIVMNVVYALCAYPAGLLADRIAAKPLLISGLLLLIVADILLVVAVSPVWAFLGAAFWGLHLAFTQGLLAKLVADTAPVELRGTAFGIFNLVSGGSLLLASVIAGVLWSVYGPAATFLAGAVFATLAALGLLLYRPGSAFFR